MPKVAITDYEAFEDLRIEKEVLEPLGCEVTGQRAYVGEKELIDLVRDADYVVTLYAPVTKKVIDSMERCKVVVRYGIGVDNIDIKAAAERNIPACNNPDYCIDEVADHTVALVLSLTRKIVMASKKAREGLAPSDATPFNLRVLRGMTIGSIGSGRIGIQTIRRLKPFGCRILVYDPFVDKTTVEKEGCEAKELDELLLASDIVVLQCPCNDSTKHIINSESIAKMKNDAMLVNASRGPLIAGEDLIKALESGKIAAAALDVTEPEPLPLDSPLFKMENVIITNHIAYASDKSMITLRTGAMRPILCSLKGEKICNCVNGVVE